MVENAEQLFSQLQVVCVRLEELRIESVKVP